MFTLPVPSAAVHVVLMLGMQGGGLVEVRGGGDAVAVAVDVDAVWGACKDEVGGAEQGGGAVGAWP